MKKVIAIICIFSLLLGCCFTVSADTAVSQPEYLGLDKPRISYDECLSKLIDCPAVSEILVPRLASGGLPSSFSIDDSGSYGFFYGCTLSCYPDAVLLDVGVVNRGMTKNRWAPYIALCKAVEIKKITDPVSRKLCDMNRDAVLNAADALEILKKAVGK